jgi:UDP-glucose 6-dehydrogenase
MTKVLLANELAVICERLGLPYARVAELAALDPRMGATHLQVPGHDGYRGAGGHCLPKDTENLRHLARALGTGEKILTAVIERNRELRERMDWLEMKGRAVTDQQPDEARARESA